MHLSPEQLQPRVGGPRGLKDAHTRVCASQLLPQAGGAPQTPRPEPLPRGRRPPRAFWGRGRQGEPDVTRGLSQSQLAFEQPQGDSLVTARIRGDTECGGATMTLPPPQAWTPSVPLIEGETEAGDCLDRDPGGPLQVGCPVPNGPREGQGAAWRHTANWGGEE